MTWGEVELEPEVRDWIRALSQDDQETVAFYVELLAVRGPLLSEPHSRQLDGKLRELRFHLNESDLRITYWIASGRRIILLTVFRKTRMREAGEVDRARRALRRCVAEQHTVDEDEEWAR
ncbi:type II toxin-antitoxin system RelE/ParE family toxin [Kitasatospora sp. NPDC059160]|uniref:type II toxin-antitoxin system RelE/ParE family toxin n=1 Tax=unclassified Kitasatospora TaxID=2633591 RepID=UPI0036BA27FE